MSVANVNRPVSLPKAILKITVSLSAMLVSSIAFAIPANREEWSFSMLVGAHRPPLTSMYQGLFQAPVLGRGGVIVDSETGQREQQNFAFDSQVPSSPIGAKASFELQWHASASHTLVLGLGSWERSSFGISTGTMPTEGSLNDVRLERRITLAYSEYNIGWRYTLFNYRNWQFYSRLSIHEIFGVDFKETDVFHYVSGSGLAGFQRIAILRAQTAALILPQFGLGAEWYFQNWFSLGLEGGYLYNWRDAELKDPDLKYDFTEQDDVTLSGMPYGGTADGHVGYLDPSSTAESPLYQRMRLSFGGVQVFLRFNFYY